MTKNTKTLLFTLVLTLFIGMGALINVSFMSFSVSADDLEQRSTRAPRNTRQPRGTKTPTPRGFVASPTPTPGEEGGGGGGCGKLNDGIKPTDDYAFLINDDHDMAVVVNLDDPSDYLVLPEHTQGIQWLQSAFNGEYAWTIDASARMWDCGGEGYLPEFRAHLFIWDAEDGEPVYASTRYADDSGYNPGTVVWSPDGERALILTNTANYPWQELVVVDFEDDYAVQYYENYVVDARWHSSGDFIFADFIDEENTTDEFNPAKLTYVLSAYDLNEWWYWLQDPYREPTYMRDDGAYLIYNDEGSLAYLDCCDADLSYYIEAAQVGPVASPDNTLFASVVFDMVMVWDSETLEPINVVGTGIEMDEPTIQWSDDGGQLAVFDGSTAIIVSTYTPEFAVIEITDGEIYRLLWNSYNDQILVIDSNENIQLWDLYLADGNATFVQSTGLWFEGMLFTPNDIAWAWDDTVIIADTGFLYGLPVEGFFIRNLLYVWDLSSWDEPQHVPLEGYETFSVIDDGAEVYAVTVSTLYELTRDNMYELEAVFDANDAVPSLPALVPSELWDFSCPQADLPPHLAQGQEVMVIMTPSLPGYSQPSFNADIVTEIQPYDLLYVADGPVCAEGYVWWNVHYRNWQTGEDVYVWAAEAGNGEYWIDDYKYIEPAG